MSYHKAQNGTVYILTTKTHNLIKIGMTTRNVNERLKELNGASANPYPLVLHSSIDCDNPYKVEQMMHSHYSSERVNEAREFFDTSPVDALKTLEEITSKTYTQPERGLFDFEFSDEELHQWELERPEREAKAKAEYEEERDARLAKYEARRLVEAQEKEKQRKKDEFTKGDAFIGFGLLIAIALGVFL